MGEMLNHTSFSDSSTAMVQKESESGDKSQSFDNEGIAKEILRLADSHGIPVYQYPELVNMLFRLELNASIPAEIHRVMSAVLDWVAELKMTREDGQRSGHNDH